MPQTAASDERPSEKPYGAAIAVLHALLAAALFADVLFAGAASAQTPPLPGRRDGAPSSAAAPAAPPAARSTLRLGAVLSEGGVPITAGLTWRVERSAAGNWTQVWSGAGAEAELQVPEGEYRVQVRYGLAEASAPVIAQAGQTATQVIPLNAGVLAARALAVPGGAPVGPALFTVAAIEAGARREIGRSSAEPATFYVNAGRYALRAESGLASLETEVEVIAGKVTSVEMALNVGSLELKTFAANGVPKLLPATHHVYTQETPSAEARVKPLLRIVGSAHRVELPAGSYRIETLAGLARQETVVTITAGQTTSQAIVLNAGEVKVEAAATPPDTCEVQAAGSWISTSRAIGRAAGPAPVFILPAGTYTIRCVRAGPPKSAWTWSGEVKAGETVDAALQRS